MVYRIDGAKLALVAQAKVGGWSQGVAWSRDGKTLLAQSMLDKALDVLSFDGKSLRCRQDQGAGRRSRRAHGREVI